MTYFPASVSDSGVRRIVYCTFLWGEMNDSNWWWGLKVFLVYFIDKTQPMAVYLERAVIRDHSETLLIVNFLSFQQQRQQAVRKATVCLHPLQVDNIFTFIRQVAPLPACWLFRTSATSWPFDLESGVRVTCDVGYLCANLILHRPLCSRVSRPMYVTDRRQTKASLNASTLLGQRHNKPVWQPLFWDRPLLSWLHCFVGWVTAVWRTLM